LVYLKLIQEYNPYDIIAEFNSDFPFYFGNSSKQINESQIDFAFLVAHELTHGLGIDTQWTNFEDETPPFSITPPINLNGFDSEGNTFSSFELLSAFDNNVVNSFTKTKISDVSKDILSYRIKEPSSLSQFIIDFKNSYKSYQASQFINYVLTNGSKSISFQTFDGSLVPLQTFSKFQSGTSVEHLDLGTFIDTKDFLMIPALTNLKGRTLEEIIDSITNGSGIFSFNVGLAFGGCYGPNMISILRTLGWYW
jgi:hypothetical protein